MEKTDITVLVAEDDEAILAMYCMSLRKRFTTVLDAADGKIAWDIFQEEFKNRREIPVVVTDADMPGMDGIELIQRISKVSPATQILIVSGLFKSSISIHAVNEYVTYLPKPLDVMLLNLAVSKAYGYYPQAVWLEKLKAEVWDRNFNEDAVLEIIREAPWIQNV
ncbi:MAG: response regulator [Desulfobacteraceae bacterium]|nr:MAG: response regulator [Desulfobacteraceae bacterium]